MAVILENDLLELAYIVLFLFWLVFVYIVKNFDYWKQRGVPYKPASFPLGSFPELILGHTNYAISFNRTYKQFRHHRFFGYIEVRNPVIVINDPELIKDIFSKRFNCFTDRVNSRTAPNDFLYHNLVTMRGKEWKEMRFKLTPAYTACKMKMMFHLVKECGDSLQRAVEKKLTVDNIVDINDLIQRFTIDSIGSCAFGFDVKTLANENSQFYKVARIIFTYNYGHLLKMYLVRVFPWLEKFNLFSMVRTETTSYITSIINDTVKYREANNVERFDFMDLLIKIRQNESIIDEEDSDNSENNVESNSKNDGSYGMTLEQMAAEAFIFFGAGFETSSSVITFCLYELSCNQDIQDRVFQEVQEVLGRHDSMSFQALQEITYLDQTIKETMRFYPPIACVSRVCTLDYDIPESEVRIEKGIIVMIPIYALHHDARYFPNPEKFDPDRFSPENYNEKNLQYVYIPFGEGPRMCIGLRFGLLLVKAAVVSLIYNYALSLAPDNEMPVQLHRMKYILHPDKPLHLVFSRRRH